MLKINNQSYIRKAVFVYDTNKKFLGKYEGVKDAQRAFNINHSTIKKYARIGSISSVAKHHIFSYERLIN